MDRPQQWFYPLHFLVLLSWQSYMHHAGMALGYDMAGQEHVGRGSAPALQNPPGAPGGMA